jgi:uncharacterized protein (TIGR03437 family)
MRHALGAIPFLFVMGALPAVTDTLPASCGPVGAKSYAPPAVTIPPVILNRGTVITVTNATMLRNGDTSSVKALVAKPGLDGISIQEAIDATNNDPGTWVIQFAPSLKGSAIIVDSELNGDGRPGGMDFMTGGNVTINGDIDGDGKPDITFTSKSGTSTSFFVFSGGNTLYGLALQGCGTCVVVRRPNGDFGLPVAAGKTFSNVIGNLVMTNVRGTGICFCPNSGGGAVVPGAVSGNTWDHVMITGNTITGSVSGPQFGINMDFSGRDTLQHAIIANNQIDLPAPNAIAIGLGAGGGIGEKNDWLLDTLIANNTISSVNPQGIVIGLGGNASNLGNSPLGDPAGGDGGSGNLIDGMQIIANQIRITGPLPANGGQVVGISLTLGDTPKDGFRLPVIQYAENNIARNIGILANTIEGPARTGIFVYAGSGTVRNDMIANLSILGNTITGATNSGMILQGADSLGSPAPSTGNSLSNVLVQANSIQIPVARGNYTFEISAGGILVLTGARAPGNSVNGISIGNNDVDTSFIGINVAGGWGVGTPFSGPPFPADNNIVSSAQIYCNQIRQTPALFGPASSGIKGVNVMAGVDDAHGNQVQQLYVQNNLVAGVLGDASLFANLGDGASGNSISTSGPANGPAFTTAGLLSAATLQHRALAPGALVSLFGLNLDGATVQFDGITAPILYASSSQLNLQVPWELQGKWSSSVTVTVNGVPGPPQLVALGSADPGVFSLGAPQGGQGAIVNANGIVVGADSPAHAGDYLQIYSTGLGAVSNTPKTGALALASPLSSLITNPTVTIGGVPAPVSFAGLAPGFVGLYQVNVQVPPGVAAGDAVQVVVSTGAIASNAVRISVR